jgi:MFS family permease
VLPSLLGPPIAGLLAEAVSWRAAFLAVLPLLPLPLWVLWHRLRGWRPGAATQRPSGGSGRLLFGLLLAGGAGLGQGAWHLLAAPAGTSRWAWAAAVAGTALAGLGLVGLLPTGVWRLRRGTASLVTFRAGINAAFFGGEAFVTLMLVEQRGAAPVLAGMALTVASLGWSAASWSQGHWPSRRPDGVDRFRLAAVGAAVLAAGLFALTATPLDRVPAALVAPFWGLAGLGMGWAMSCSSVLMLRLAPPGTAGRTATSVQLGDNLGTMLGIGAAGALFAARYRPDGDHAGVFVAIWAGLGLVALLTALVGLRIRPRAGASPASTPGPGSAEPVESR